MPRVINERLVKKAFHKFENDSLGIKLSFYFILSIGHVITDSENT